MKVTFDFKGFKEIKAIGIAKHNRRDLSHIQGNLKVDDSTIPGGIDATKIGNNLIRTDSFKNVSQLLAGRKVIGGLQKATQEYTGFVISIGNAEEGTLPKEELKNFFDATDQWLRTQFGEKYLLQSIEHWDEALPKIKILMANVVDYKGDDSKKSGKVYLSSKHKFGYEDAKNRNDIRLLAKQLQLKFHAEVASRWGVAGVEAPNQEFGETGKRIKAEFIGAKNNEALQKNKRLREKNKQLAEQSNQMLVDFKAMKKVVSSEKWNELMKELKHEKELEQNKLKQFKEKGKERIL